MIKTTSIILGISLLIGGAAVLLNFSPGNFKAKKEHNKIIVFNASENHFPGVTIKCRFEGEDYNTSYRFLSGKSTSALSAHDFTDKKGRALPDIGQVSYVEIIGGDNLLDELVDEKVMLN